MPHATKPQKQTRVVAVLGAIAMSVVITLSALLVGSTSANATDRSGGGQTVVTTLNVPAMPLDNLCNGDVVNLSGDATIRITTTPRSDGGVTVRSVFDARNLRGSRIAPLPMIGYHGDYVENSYQYVAPPPYPTSARVTHYTKLVPEANAPTMYLVVVIRETLFADGTVVPVAERAHLVCKEPRCSHQRG